ncbi:MAG: hypothetical protein HY582_04795 [Candidatus Omnitrophica bacterium]|nr:hypothetical protein [Candidatus Omnitrophota bacterium]
MKQLYQLNQLLRGEMTFPMVTALRNLIGLRSLVEQPQLLILQVLLKGVQKSRILAGMLSIDTMFSQYSQRLRELAPNDSEEVRLVHEISKFLPPQPARIPRNQAPDVDEYDSKPRSSPITSGSELSLSSSKSELRMEASQALDRVLEKIAEANKAISTLDGNVQAGQLAGVKKVIAELSTTVQELKTKIGQNVAWSEIVVIATKFAHILRGLKSITDASLKELVKPIETHVHEAVVLLGKIQMQIAPNQPDQVFGGNASEEFPSEQAAYTIRFNPERLVFRNIEQLNGDVTASVLEERIKGAILDLVVRHKKISTLEIEVSDGKGGKKTAKFDIDLKGKEAVGEPISVAVKYSGIGILNAQAFVTRSELRAGAQNVNETAQQTQALEPLTREVLAQLLAETFKRTKKYGFQVKSPGFDQEATNPLVVVVTVNLPWEKATYQEADGSPGKRELNLLDQFASQLQAALAERFSHYEIHLTKGKRVDGSAKLNFVQLHLFNKSKLEAAKSELRQIEDVNVGRNGVITVQFSSNAKQEVKPDQLEATLRKGGVTRISPLTTSADNWAKLRIRFADGREKEISFERSELRISNPAEWRNEKPKAQIPDVEISRSRDGRRSLTVEEIRAFNAMSENLVEEKAQKGIGAIVDHVIAQSAELPADTRQNFLRLLLPARFQSTETTQDVGFIFTTEFASDYLPFIPAIAQNLGKPFSFVIPRHLSYLYQEILKIQREMSLLGIKFHIAEDYDQAKAYLKQFDKEQVDEQFSFQIFAVGSKHDAGLRGLLFENYIIGNLKDLVIIQNVGELSRFFDFISHELIAQYYGYRKVAIAA